MPPKTLQARTSAHSIEKYMKTEYDAYAAFLTSRQGGKGTPLFLCPLLRFRGKKSLDLQGIGDAFLAWQGIYA